MCLLASLVSLVLVLSSGSTGWAAEAGSVAGVVTDKDTGEPLSGTNVLIEGTKLGGTADEKGAYVIENVPVGTGALSVLRIYAAWSYWAGQRCLYCFQKASQRSDLT